MFALLEHDPGPGPDAVHWDFLIEVPGQELLATWRLLDLPIGGPATIAAERIADHRPAFLNYEGPLTRARGSVRRLDRGEAMVTHVTDTEFVAELHGEHLRGTYEIVAVAATRLVFRRT